MSDDPKKIVVADDDEDLCDLIQTVLAGEGYLVDTVNNGFELIAYLKENQDIDAVILDLVMPDRGGSTIFETIRSVSPASKIIIHTGHTDYRGSIYDRESDAFIEKTEGAEKIIKVLEELL